MSIKIKLEHYVPRCYLRNFSVVGGDDYLFCFDKMKSRTFKVNNRNVAAEATFYDTHRDSKQRVERYLSYLESFFDASCRKVIATEDLDGLTEFDFMILARFIATQEVRTKEHRTRMMKAYQQQSSRMKQSTKVVKETDSLLHQLNSEEGIKSLHVNTINNIEPLIADLSIMGWALVINCTSLSFWCSDHPCNHYYHIEMSPLGNLGIKCKTIWAYFPLSPKLCLCFYEPIEDGSRRCRCEVQDIRQIIYQNYLQVYGSSRFVFSSEGDLFLAEQIMAYKDKNLLLKPW